MLGEIATGLQIAGGITGLFGKKKKPEGSTMPQSGFETLPEPVKKAFLDTFLPGVMKQFDKPYQPIPMKRANAPTTPFDSAGLHELQQFSDAIGGLFSTPGAPVGGIYGYGAGPQANGAAGSGAPAKPAGPLNIESYTGSDGKSMAWGPSAVNMAAQKGGNVVMSDGRTVPVKKLQEAVKAKGGAWWGNVTDFSSYL